MTNEDAFKEKPKYDTDERFYVLSKNKDGGSKVKIRFIPSLSADGTQFQQWTTQKVHGINWYQKAMDKNSPKRWANMICRCNQGSEEKTCPVCQYGFAKGGEIQKKDGDKHKNDPDQVLRKKYYQEFVSKDEIITNIMVVKDPENPENEGKIFLFKLKTSLYKMFNTESEKVRNEIDECTTPEELAERGIPATLRGFDPFNIQNSKDLWIIKKSGKEVTSANDWYSSSYWDTIYTDKTGGNGDLAMDLIKKAYCLDEFVQKEQIIPMSEMIKKLHNVTFDDSKRYMDEDGVFYDEPLDEIPKGKTRASDAPAKKEVKEVVTPKVEDVGSVDDILNDLGTDVADTPKVEEEPKEEKAEVVKTPPKKETSKADDEIDLDALLADL